MIKKLLFTLSVIILFGSIAYSQTTIQGAVKSPSGSAQVGVMVQLQSEGRTVNGGYTDDKGEYQIFGVSAGTYDLVAGGGVSCPSSTRQSGISVTANEVKFVDFTLDCSSTELQEVVVVYKAPLFDADNTKSSDNISGDEVRKLPGRSLSGALANLGGVAGVDGGITSVRGNRPDGQQTIVDGVRLRGGGISMQAVESAELIQGGIPAEYGDGTSYMVYTTKGISRNYHGSAEVMGSIDGYNNFLVAGMVTGPFVQPKSENEQAAVGFLLSAEAYYNKDSYPARGGTWIANDDLIQSLIQKPLRYDNLQLGVAYPEAYYLTNDGSNFSKIRARQNAQNYGCQVDGKLDFLMGGKDARGNKKNNVRLSIGASYQFSKGYSWSGQAATLFNSVNNPLSINHALRLNARFNHRIKTDSASALKNVMYDINVNYTITKGVSQDARFKDNYFDYGYIGKFTTTKAKYYAPVDHLVITMDSIPVDIYDVNVLATVYDSIVSFDGSNSSNPELAWYTQNFVDNYPNTFFNELYGTQTPYSTERYQQFGALLNGDAAPLVYGMFYLPGTVMSGYSKSSTQSIGAKASLSLNIKNNDIKLGFEFDKYIARAWGVSPTSLWTLMRQYQNSHMLGLELLNPIFISDDTIDYNQDVDLASQTNFDRNLRIALGLDPNGSDWLDIDSYDPSTFKLSMFSANELFNNGTPLVSYYGYDYTGEHINKNQTSISTFFDGLDTDGDGKVDKYDFSIGAYQPVYLAMYIQDKFAIKSMLFNIGLRVDRFDANQQVLKDPFLFREAHTVASLLAAEPDFASQIRADNAEDSWVVYVGEKGEVANPSTQQIIGYRNGNTWYDANGQEITDPTTILGANGGPILLENFDPESIGKNVSGKAFKDYKPQWSIMPRISFSFPVSQQSLFYAHYNIITYRPSNLQLDPLEYLFIDKEAARGSVLTNPNLRPQKSIDYEIGFRQKLGDNSAISIAAYYSEKRDQIQSYRYTGAYPTTYYSYDNIDFGTVQGFTLGYNLRSDKYLTLRATYTLQFAKGTGSSSGSNLEIIKSGQPNLRTLTNLEFDQRHRLTADLFFDLPTGSQYTKEKLPQTDRINKKTGEKKTIRWFEGVGASLRFSAASGQPYSRSSTVYSNIANQGKAQLSGSINGSNMPWIFQCDLRIYKSFALNLAAKNNKKTENSKPKNKPGSLMVYLDVQNLFNFKNIISVYRYTGNPEDDGYLAAAQYQQNINQQIYVPAYTDYYIMRMQNPYNYSLPTRVNIGVQFSF